MWTGLALNSRPSSINKRVKMQMVGEIGRKEKGSINLQVFLKAMVPIIPKTPIAR